MGYCPDAFFICKGVIHIYNQFIKIKMKRSIVFFICTFILFGSIIAQKVGYSIMTGKYFGQKTPGMTPEVFAPGIVSVPDVKYNTITFSSKGDEFYLYRWDGAIARILFSRIVNGVWTTLDEVEFTKGYKAMEPHITFDNKTIYFIWDKPIPTGEQETPFKIWFSERTSKGWTEPDYAGVGMFVSSDREGNIYTTDMTSVMTTGKTYLSKVKIENNKFVGYEKLSIPQYDGYQAHPCIAPDGSFLIFDVDSGHHLLVSFKKSDGTWGNAIDLANHGFDIMAGGASITPDGKYLFFNCKDQLWWVHIKVITELRPKE
jgi:hypothetical protein